MLIAFALIAAASAGYVGSIYSWPLLRPMLVGIEVEIEDLQAKLRALEAKLRG